MLQVLLASLLLVAAGCGRSIEPESELGDQMKCGQGVSCTSPCFCERTCILWFCWGKPYCECR